MHSRTRILRVATSTVGALVLLSWGASTVAATTGGNPSPADPGAVPKTGTNTGGLGNAITATTVKPTPSPAAVLSANLPSSLREKVDAADAIADVGGAHTEIAMLDRYTGIAADNGTAAHLPTETASVVKVFIAEDVLYRQQQGELTLSDDENNRLQQMLASSSDDAADYFWNTYGGNRLVTDVVGRYHLTETSPPSDQWWDTLTTAADLASFYNQLASGSGGLRAEGRDAIIGALTGATPLGTDGYNQQFGLESTQITGVPIAAKQGWMISHENDWVHNSTGYAGSDNRYVVVILSKRSASAGDAASRATVDSVAAALVATNLS